MHVVLPANCARVAQPPRDLIDRGDDIGLRLFCRLELPQIAQCRGGEGRTSPRAKVLGGDLSARYAPQIIVDVARIHRLPTTVTIQILKELLTGELLTALHDVGDAAVGYRHQVRDAALAAELEAELRARHRHMPAPQCR